MKPTFKYEAINVGKAIPMEELKAEVEKTWPDHQIFISKILHGLGMGECE